MKSIEKWKTWVFIGSLLVIWLCIHAALSARWQSSSPSYPVTQYQQYQPAQPPRQSAQTIARSNSERSSERPQSQQPNANNTRSSVSQTDREAPRTRAAQRTFAPDPGEASRRRAEALAAERQRFLERYLSSGFSRNPKAKTVALVVVAEDGKPNRSVSDSLKYRFQTEGVEFTTTFFKPTFGADGLLAQVLSGTTDVLDRLGVARSIDGLLLARQNVQYSTNPSLENVLTATMQLEVRAMTTRDNSNARTWTLKASGAGFKQGDARAMAEERLLKQIEKDTKMSFTDIFPSK